MKIFFEYFYLIITQRLKKSNPPERKKIIEATMLLKGITRKDLATLLEISVDSLNKRMRGVYQFTPAEKIVICDFLNFHSVSREELFRKREEGKT